jgi:hypothetical protein
MSSDYLQRIADEWRARAAELAAWTMLRLVNRADVWGRYLKAKQESAGQTRNKAITAPFRDERGKVFLNASSLEKHYKGQSVLGLHSTSSDWTSRWLAIDVDRHDPDDLSVSAEANFVAAQGWHRQLAGQGLDPLLLDSNGEGGFHLWLLFDEPLATAGVARFGRELVADYQTRGLDERPEVFPGRPEWDRYGDWLRLPGRHHTRAHYTRVWNDEPWADEPWLEGHDAIDRILRARPTPVELAAKLGIERARRTICLDFDGTVHSYHSGWCGATVIPDEPTHGAREAIARLRESHRVVIHSARCRTAEGRSAIEAWLARHGIEVDEVCEHKPPASIYVDDRALPFRGDWQQTVADIRNWRK